MNITTSHCRYGICNHHHFVPHYGLGHEVDDLVVKVVDSSEHHHQQGQYHHRRDRHLWEKQNSGKKELQYKDSWCKMLYYIITTHKMDSIIEFELRSIN